MKLHPKHPFGLIVSLSGSKGSSFNRLIFKAGCQGLANTLEIRLDTMTGHTDFLQSIPEVVNNKPTILTVRSVGNGGLAQLNSPGQLKFWQSIPERLSSAICDLDRPMFVDFDLDLVAYAMSQGIALPFPESKIGTSVHVFDETPQDPQDLDVLFADLQVSTGTAFLKLVTMATKDTDNDLMADLLKRCVDPRPIIAFCMGKAGQRSRVECFDYGSAGSYGLMAGHAQAAPGQLTLGEMRTHPSVRRALGLS